MPTLKDLGIELQSFAPIPNSVIVGRFSFGELDVDNLRDIAKAVYDAFMEQDVGNQVIFVPTDLALERMSKDGLLIVKEHIEALIEECEE